MRKVVPSDKQTMSLIAETDSIQDKNYQNSGGVLNISCKKILSIKTGEMRHIEEIESSFAEQNVSMTSNVSAMMYDHHFSMSREGHRLTQFACIPVGELFPKKASTFNYEQILAAAIGNKISIEGELFFLTYCYPQDGMDIRVDYADQKENEMLHLAMEKALPDAKGDLRIFSVGKINKAEPTLYATTIQESSDKEEKRKFRLNDTMVFRLRKEEACF